MKKIIRCAFSSVLFAVLLLNLGNGVDCRQEEFAGGNESKTIKLPTLGVGVLDIKSEIEQENALVFALDAGYRMIDIWEGEEVQVKNAILRTKVPREEVFIVVKLNPPETLDQLYDTGEAVENTLKRLETSYVDLLLMNYADFNNQHLRRWRAMISLKNRGKAKLIGVSNFNFEQVSSLGSATAILPSVVQLEINPFFQQDELVKNLTAKGIKIQAYSPLANGHKLEDTKLKEIAKKHDATTAQVLIQWCIQKGYSCITKSTKKLHLEDNINLEDFSLEDEDMKKLGSLEEGFVTNYDPNDPRFYEKSFYQARETESGTRTGRRGDDLDDEQLADENYYFDGKDHSAASVGEDAPGSGEHDNQHSKQSQSSIELEEDVSEKHGLKGETSRMPSSETSRAGPGISGGDRVKNRDEF